MLLKAGDMFQDLKASGYVHILLIGVIWSYIHSFSNHGEPIHVLYNWCPIKIEEDVYEEDMDYCWRIMPNYCIEGHYGCGLEGK